MTRILSTVNKLNKDLINLIRKFLLLFKSLSFRLLLAVVFAYVATPWLSQYYIMLFYTISTTLKTILMAILPIVIFSYIFASMLKFASKAPLLLGLVLITILISISCSLNFALFSARIFVPIIVPKGLSLAQQSKPAIEALFHMNLPSFWCSSYAMLAALFFGCVFGIVQSPCVCMIGDKMKDVATQLLQWFIPFLPFFILGFVAKLRYEDLLNSLIVGYGKCVFLIIAALFVYIFVLMLIANAFHVVKATRNFKACFGVIITAFTTMSSLATLPLVFNVVKTHTRDENYPNFILPISSNIHMTGDNIMFGITIIALIYLYDLPMPTMMQFLQFNYLYLISRFSVAGVPAGSILVTAPIAQSVFHFSNEITGVFTTLCILLDCVATVGNTLGNVVFAQITHKLFGKILQNANKGCPL